MEFNETFRNYIFVGIVILWLFALIALSAIKIHIYFSSFLFLSKKKNYDKANYIVNSSFYKLFYNNPLNFNTERGFAIILVFLTILAVIGNIGYGAANYGYLNYYYGDNEEYDFVDYYIKIIMVLGFIYLVSYIFWYFYGDKEKDDKLDDNETELKKIVLNNIDYDYLYYYYINKIVNNEDINIDTYIKNNQSSTGAVAAGTYGDMLNDTTTLFKLCFTIHLLSPNRTEFANIQKKIFYICKITYDDTTTKEEKKDHTKFKTKIDKPLKDSTFYIIANYNNNNSVALPPLEKLIKDTLNSVNTPNIIRIRNETITAIQENKLKSLDAISTYEIISKKFKDTIKIYKEIYDKYYIYYIYSVLITNFLVTYSILIFLYIFIKWGDSTTSKYSIYAFKTDIKTYGYYILMFYYIFTCPIILFGSA